MHSISEISNSQENIQEDAITVSHLSKNYGAFKAVSDLSFSVKRGEIVGFLGPNGAGKSTTMRILSGLMSANSGVVKICGISVANDSFATKEHLGYMLENNPLPEELRVIEYLRWRAKLKNIPRKEIHDRVEEVMDACDLSRKAKRKLIGTLSKGFRQRVGIADALLSKPDVVILDEPTIGLDPHQIRSIRSLIQNLKGKHAVLISSHILPEIENVCDSVIIINQGRIVAKGSPDDLRKEFVQNKNFILICNSNKEDIQKNLNIENIKESTDFKSNENLKKFIIKIKPSSDIPLLEKLQKSGIYVQEFYEKVPSLEDIFVLATKRSYEQVTPIEKK